MDQYTGGNVGNSPLFFLRLKRCANGCFVILLFVYTRYTHLLLYLQSVQYLYYLLTNFVLACMYSMYSTTLSV